MSTYESEPGVPPVRIRRLRAAPWRRETLLKRDGKLVVSRSTHGPAEWTYAALIELASQPEEWPAAESSRERQEG